MSDCFENDTNEKPSEMCNFESEEKRQPKFENNSFVSGKSSLEEPSSSMQITGKVIDRKHDESMSTIRYSQIMPEAHINLGHQFESLLHMNEEEHLIAYNNTLAGRVNHDSAPLDAIIANEMNADVRKAAVSRNSIDPKKLCCTIV